MARSVAAIAALVAWAALALQLVLIIQTMGADGVSVAGAIWRFVGFFTILANLGVAIVASAMALRVNGVLAGPRARLAAVTAIVFVGIVYSIALRSIWAPTGWQKIADHALHDATPILFLLAWILAPHGGLSRRDVLWAAAAPLAYCVYAFLRGAIDGWYAYWFLDPAALAPAQLAVSMILLLIAFLVLAGMFVLLDRRLARRR